MTKKYTDPITATTNGDDDETTRSDNDTTTHASSASSFWSSPKDAWTRLMDEQRMERLQQCRLLEQTFKECQREQQQQQELVHNQQEKARRSSSSWWNKWSRQTTTTSDDENSNKSPANPRKQLEEFPAGIRMLRYFDWRDLGQQQQQQDNTKLVPCVREEHAVWACRAVALQCGPDLVQLRNCFQDAGPERVLMQPDSSRYSAYETAPNNKQPPKNAGHGCYQLQTQLGDCVRQNAAALQERRRKNQQQ